MWDTCPRHCTRYVTLVACLVFRLSPVSSRTHLTWPVCLQCIIPWALLSVKHNCVLQGHFLPEILNQEFLCFSTEQHSEGRPRHYMYRCYCFQISCLNRAMENDIKMHNILHIIKRMHIMKNVKMNPCFDSIFHELSTLRYTSTFQKYVPFFRYLYLQLAIRIQELIQRVLTSHSCITGLIFSFLLQYLPLSSDNLPVQPSYLMCLLPLSLSVAFRFNYVQRFRKEDPYSM